MKLKSIISRINLPAKASMAYLAASILGKAIGILTTPFFTRLISEEDYGSLTLYMTLLGIASIISSAISSGSQVYSGLKKFQDKRGEFLKTLVLVSVGFSTVVCILLFTFSPFVDFSRSLILPLALQIICDGISGIGLSRARFQYRYFEVMAINVISSALPPLLSLFIIDKLGFGYLARIYLMLLISMIIAAIHLVRIFRLNGKITLKMSKYIARLTLPLLPHSISTALSGQADKLFITRIMGQGSLAKYSVVHSLGMALQFAVSALGSALGPWIIRRIERSEEEKIRETVGRLFSLFCAASLALCIIGPEAMLLLAPEKYAQALPCLIPIALSTPLYLLSYVLTVCLVHYGKGKSCALSSTVHLILSLLLNYALIPTFGYLGAGISLLISSVGSVSLSLLNLGKGKEKRIIDTRGIVISFLLTLIPGISGILLYGRASIRILLLIFPAIWGLKSLFDCASLIKEKKPA